MEKACGLLLPVIIFLRQAMRDELCRLCGLRLLQRTFWMPILLLALLACNQRGVEERSRATADPSKPAAPESVPVKVVRPFFGEISQSIRTSGSLEAESEADVYSKLVGLCERVFVEEGDQVKSGDLLAKIEDEEIRLAYEQAKARREKASADFERTRELYADGLSSQQAYQDASLQLKLFQADYDLASKRLEDTSLTAPISGLITERKIKVGDLVGATQPLFRIVDLDPVRAQVYVPERDYFKIRQGQTVVLALDSFPGRTFRSSVERLNPVIDPTSGMARVTITVQNPERVLRPGMFSRVQIVTDVHPNALLLPKEAIVLRGEQNLVYVVRGDVAYEVGIVTGFQEADRVEVLQGLTPEDRVVAMGHLGLQNETRVRVVDESQG